MSDKLRVLKDFGPFHVGDEIEVDETNPFAIREKCLRYVVSGRAEWVDEPPAEPDHGLIEEELAAAGIQVPELSAADEPAAEEQPLEPDPRLEEKPDES